MDREAILMLSCKLVVEFMTVNLLTRQNKLIDLKEESESVGDDEEKDNLNREFFNCEFIIL